MRVLVDTNVLVRLVLPMSPQFAQAKTAIESLMAKNARLMVVPQVMYEFWVVCTRPTSANGLGLSISDALAEMQKIREVFSLLLDERAIFDRWEQIVREFNIGGRKAHDARIVAAMFRHNIPNILTFNARDFATYSGITTLVPGQ